MTRVIVAFWIICAISPCLAVDLNMGPVGHDWSYGAYSEGPCDRCIPGVKPALTTSHWVITATTLERHPDQPWLKIRINGFDTELGKLVAVVDGELMLPVTSVVEFGLTPTRDRDNHRLLTLSGGRYPVKLVIGRREAEIGGARRVLPVPPKWHKGKVYIPITAIGDLLDWGMSFDAGAGLLEVSTRRTGLSADRAIDLPDMRADSARASSRTERAQALIREGKLAEAETIAREAIAVDPSSAVAYNILGYTLRKQGKGTEALAAYRGAIRLAPDFALAHNNLGIALLAQEQTKDAVDALAKAATLAPERADFLANLGIALFEDEKPDDATSVWAKAASLDSSCKARINEYLKRHARAGTDPRSVPTARVGAAVDSPRPASAPGAARVVSPAAL